MATSLDRILGFTFLTLIVSLGGLAVAISLAVKDVPTPVDDGKAEIVLRHVFKTAEPALVNGASIFCVGVNQGDASPGLLNRLKDVAPNVQPASRCTWEMGQAVDVRTAKPATFFFVRSQICDWWRPECNVATVYAAGNLGGHGLNYRLEKQGKLWFVKGVKPLWIS